jgi:hypothetical protein
VTDDTSELYFDVPDNLSILEYKPIGPGSFILLARDGTSSGTAAYLITDGDTSQKFAVVPFNFGNLLTWNIKVSASGFEGALFYSKNGEVYGYGFGDSTPLQIVIARESAQDYVDVALAAIDDGVGSVHLGFNDGDDQNIEVIRVAFWEYDSLRLPIADSGVDTGTFIFADFLLALTRVKNDAYAAFDQPEINSAQEWVPSDWDEETGLKLEISFNDGVKLTKTESILLSIAEELEVLIERECEYREFLSCDSIDITMTYTVVNDGTTTSRKRVILENVVFMVTGSGHLFVPSLIISLVTVMLMNLF